MELCINPRLQIRHGKRAQTLYKSIGFNNKIQEKRYKNGHSHITALPSMVLHGDVAYNWKHFRSVWNLLQSVSTPVSCWGATKNACQQKGKKHLIICRESRNWNNANKTGRFAQVCMSSKSIQKVRDEDYINVSLLGELLSSKNNFLMDDLNVNSQPTNFKLNSRARVININEKHPGWKSLSLCQICMNCWNVDFTEPIIG